MKKKLLAFLLAGILVSQFGAAALAEENTITETVNVKAESGHTPVEESINEDVNVAHGDGVKVSAHGTGDKTSASAIINGDVSGQENGVEVIAEPVARPGDTATSSTAEVTINGNISAQDENGIEITANADSYGESNHASKSDATANVTVNSGDVVSANGAGIKIETSAEPGGSADQSSASSTVNVIINSDESGNGGNVTGVNGILIITSNDTSNTNGENVVWVRADGDVTATNGDGINISTDDDCQNDAFVAVGGDVSGKNGVVLSGDGIWVFVNGTISGTDAAVVVKGESVPRILVEKLSVSDGGQLIKADTDEMTQKVAQNISYLVSASDNVTVTDDEYFFSAQENDTIHIKVANGYELSGAGEYAVVEDNGDGTYTITVKQGGDLVFTAKVKYVPVVLSEVTQTYAEPQTSVNSLPSGNVTDSEQSVMTVSMKASHFRKAFLDGEELSENSYTTAADSHGLLTIRFTTDFLKTLSEGSHKLVLQGTDTTVNLRLIVSADGSYKIVC